jgi:hypothetical protein
MFETTAGTVAEGVVVADTDVAVAETVVVCCVLLF